MRIFLLFLSVVSLTMNLMANDAKSGLISPIEYFWIDGNAPRGAWVSHTVDNFKKEGKLFKIKSTKPEGKIFCAFHSHMSLKQDVFNNDPSPFFFLKIRSSDVKNPVISFSWKLMGNNNTAWSTVKAESRLDGWSDILFPLPEIKNKSAAIIGYELIFQEKGNYEIKEAALISLRPVLLDSISKKHFLTNDSITIKGKTKGDIKNVQLLVFGADDQKKAALIKNVKPVNRQFSVTFSRNELPSWQKVKVIAVIDKKGLQASSPIEFFVYPKGKKIQLPVLKSSGRNLIRKGKPYALIGLNYGVPHYEHNDKRDRICDNFRKFKKWGMNCIRLVLTMPLIQPAEGVFPDSTKYKTIMAEHGLYAEFWEQIEYLIDRAAESGIYTIIDIHGFPTNPYRYFNGGKWENKKKGLPGGGIAWLSPSQTESVSFNVTNKRHKKALLTTLIWLAKHFKGNSNIAGMEIPFNEPHSPWAWLDSQANWQTILAECAKVVKAADPERFTWGMHTWWGHDNNRWIATWFRTPLVDGITTHHYMANCSTPFKGGRSDPLIIMSNSLASVFLPYAKVDFPIYNGEGGVYDCQRSLPELSPDLAASYFYENTLFETWAFGLAGHTDWTDLWEKGYIMTAYPVHIPRYAPLYREGPVNWEKSEVAFIQSTNADKRSGSNGHNFACKPVARMMMDLHLNNLHYLTDDQIIYLGVNSGTAYKPKSDEEVNAAAKDPQNMVLENVIIKDVGDKRIQLQNYKAVIVDKRRLDERALGLMKKADKGKKIPILFIDSMDKKTIEQITAFLADNGVAIDIKTPKHIQIAHTKNFLVFYNQKAPGFILDKKPEKEQIHKFKKEPPVESIQVYPHLDIKGIFRLKDEDNKTIYNGNAIELINKGVEIKLAPWRSLILKIER